MNRISLRLVAVLGAAALASLTVAPAVAATDNQAGANAVTLSVAGNANGTGLVTAKYSGGKETKTGSTTPAFPNPGNQQVVSGGVLAQEATAKPGFSAACAGLAGDGGSVIAIGDTSCLTPGDTLNGSLGSFDPSQIIGGDPSAALAQVPEPLKTQLTTLLTTLGGGSSTVTDAIQSGLDQVKSQFGDGGLVADLDLIEGRCTAGDDGPAGTSTLTNAKIAASFGDQSVTLLDLPTHPAPNTHLTTDLSAVLNLILGAVDHDLTTSLNGALGPATQITAAIRDNLVTAIHDQVESNLQPLEDNVLDVTLNRQTYPTPESIKVRALDVQVLPALKSQLNGSSLVDLQVGNAACAPVAQAVVKAPQAAPKAPKLPRSVSAGVASAPATHQGGSTGTAAFGLLALLGLCVGMVGVRRFGS